MPDSPTFATAPGDVTAKTWQPKPFDRSEPNCFSRWINLTDTQVSELLDRVTKWAGTAGEYDQDDMVTMDYDDLADILVIATKLWANP